MKLKKWKVVVVLLKCFILLLLFIMGLLGVVIYEVYGDFINFVKVGFNYLFINFVKGIYFIEIFVNFMGKLEGFVYLGRGWIVNLGGVLGG